MNANFEDGRPKAKYTDHKLIDLLAIAKSRNGAKKVATTTWHSEDDNDDVGNEDQDEISHARKINGQARTGAEDYRKKTKSRLSDDERTKADDFEVEEIGVESSRSRSKPVYEKEEETDPNGADDTQVDSDSDSDVIAEIKYSGDFVEST